MKPYNSIKFQMSCFIILLTTIILSGFGYYYFRITHAILISDLGRFAEITSIRLSRHLVLPMWILDRQRAEDTVDAEMLEKRIYAIVVKSGKEQNLFLSKKNVAAWPMIDKQENQGRYFIKKHRLLEKNDQIIGSVDVYITKKYMYQALHNVAMMIIFQVVILDVIIFAAMYLLFNNKIFKYLQIVSRIADKVSVGELEKELDLKLNNEIGVLAEAFERMRLSMVVALNKVKDTK